MLTLHDIARAEMVHTSDGQPPSMNAKKVITIDSAIRADSVVFIGTLHHVCVVLV